MTWPIQLVALALVIALSVLLVSAMLIP